MEAPPGLVVEQLTHVAQRRGFEELQGVSQGRMVSVGITEAGVFPREAASADFAQAVRGALRVSHPHVARTLAVDAAGPGRWAVAWERFEGQRLDEVLAQRGSLLPDESVSIVVALAQALGAAHEVGVLHGGLGGDHGLQWVTLTPGPQGLDTKLGGFGLALLPAFTGQRKPTVITEIAALGALLQRLITGAPHQGKVGPLPASAEHLAPILTKCLGLDVSSRFRSAKEFEQALVDSNSTRVSAGQVVPGSKPRPGGITLRTLGPWELQEVLGEGSMGQVFLAKHSVLGRKAAIKVLRPEQYHREDLIQRFFQEARSINQINHKHIVEISDFGQEFDAQGKPLAVYFVMELLQGETLGGRLARGPLPLERSLHIIRQLASALAAAHRLGVVHRDIKLDNVFLITREGDGDFVKVLDFGVAKLTQPTGAAPTVATMDGAIIGTPTTMSPEQALGNPVDQRADVYAVGVLLYRMLAGKLPLDAENFGKLFALILTAVPPPLPEKTPLGEEVAPELAAVVMSCLEKKPDQRPASMDALLEALRAPPKAKKRSRLGAGLGAALVVALGAAAVVSIGFRRTVRVVDAAVEDAGALMALGPQGTPDAGEEQPVDAGEELLAAASPSLVRDAGVEVIRKPSRPHKPVPLTTRLVAETINDRMRSVQSCGDIHAEDVRTLWNVGIHAVPVRWTIELSGEVSGVEVLEPKLQGTKMERCMVKAVKAFPFPRNLGPTRPMTQTFNFSKK